MELDTIQTKVPKPAHPIGRPRQGLDTRLIANFEAHKVRAIKAWLVNHPGQNVSSLLREALDDVMKKHGIAT